SSVLSAPFLNPPSLRSQYLPRSTDLKPQPAPQIPTAREAKAKKAQAELQKALSQTRVAPGRHAALLPMATPPANSPLPAPASFNSKQLAIGFFIDWDESSYSSLERNLDSLDWVLPQWVSLVPNSKPGDSPISDILTDPKAPGSEHEQALKALRLIRGR